MPLIVAGKGDFERLAKFEKEDFSVYELYLDLFNEDIDQQIFSLPSCIKIVSIHNPKKVKINNEIYGFDLSDPEEIGKESLKVLGETIKLAKQIGARIVVVHGAKYGLDQSKEEALSLLSKRIKKLNAQEIDLCFENDALWFNIFNSKKALLVSVEDFDRLNNLLDGKLKITMDIEHFKINLYFFKFMEYTGGEGNFMKKYPAKNPASFEKDIQKFIKKKGDALDSQFKNHLASFFTMFRNKIEHIHLCGSDYYNYSFSSEIGSLLVGEHLPLGFNNGKQKDRLDYNHLVYLFNTLPKEKQIAIVIEIWKKDPNKFILEMRKSKQFLTRYLNNKRCKTG